MFGSFESFTGGLFAYEITKIPGASKFFAGSVVAYQNRTKEKFNISTKDGVINAQTALQMTKQCRLKFGVPNCVAFTGNAGPTAMENKLVGQVYIAFNDEVFEIKLDGKRLEVQSQAVEFAINLLKERNILPK